MVEARQVSIGVMEMASVKTRRKVKALTMVKARHTPTSLTHAKRGVHDGLALKTVDGQFGGVGCQNHWLLV